MPEAVIVATARSPIGRAVKGSLRDLRPDDLAATIVDAALSKVPQLDRTLIEDLYLGAACPAASRASTWPGWSPSCSASTTCPAPRSPGTARRRCRPPGWRSTRSRPARATCSSRPASRPCPGSPGAAPTACRRTAQALVGGGWENPPFADAQARTARVRRAAAGLARPARGRRRSRTSTWPWARPRRTSPRSRTSAARRWTSSAYARQNLAEKAIADGFWEREITPVTTARRHGGRAPTTAPAPASPSRRSPASSRSSAPTAGSPPATAARSTTAPPRWSS